MLISRQDALGHTINYDYDRECNLIQTTDANGHSTGLQYDQKGRLISRTDALGNSTGYSYDAVDNVTAQTDAYGNTIFSFGYDQLYNLTTIRDFFGNSIKCDYDSTQRLIEAKMFDKQSSLIKSQGFNYDNLNNLTDATPNDNDSEKSSQAFAPNGNKTSMSDSNQNTTQFHMDNSIRVFTMTSQSGSQVADTYDDRGLLIQATNARGQATSFQYDNAGRLTGYTDPAGSVSYTYDANGNVTTVSDSTGIITRTYDDLNRVTSYTDTQGNTIRYTYDNAGNLITLTYPDGKTVQYSYDAANHLISVTDWAGHTTSYEYDKNGRLVKTVRPDGSVMTASYDEEGQLMEQKDVDRHGNVIIQYDLVYDAAGKIKTENRATPTQQFTPPNAAITTAADNRLATYSGQAVSYDADGNMTTGPLNGSMSGFTFDARNRLTAAGNTTYQYDAEDNRIVVTSGSSVTRYIIDPEAYFNEVLVRTDSQGNQTDYVWGLGLIGQEQNGQYQAYHFDYRGSTVALTDVNGNVTDRFQYGGYGELQYRSGTTDTPFMFDGKHGVMTDANGLYYMKARYYEPEIRRFINQDILLGSIDNGQSLNRYAYVNGQPVSYIDPFGNNRVTDWLGGVGAGIKNIWDNIWGIPQAPSPQVVLPAPPVPVVPPQQTPSQKPATSNDSSDWYSYTDNGWRLTNKWNDYSLSGRYWGHLANDLLVGTGGDKIRSITNGTVYLIGYNPGGNGYIVIIQHKLDGKIFYSSYSHLEKDSFSVRQGQEVKAGQILGIVGNTGNTGGIVHLHLMVIVGKPDEKMYGYYKVNNINTQFDDQGRGYFDFNNLRYYDPQLVIKTKGNIVIDNYI